MCYRRLDGKLKTFSVYPRMKQFQLENKFKIFRLRCHYKMVLPPNEDGESIFDDWVPKSPFSRRTIERMREHEKPSIFIKRDI